MYIRVMIYFFFVYPSMMKSCTQSCDNYLQFEFVVKSDFALSVRRVIGQNTLSNQTMYPSPHKFPPIVEALENGKQCNCIF